MTFDAREEARARGASRDNQTAGHVTCVVAGCGPAGAMLGLLLARRGVDVLVLEKHGDFLRDFRGDTIHPSTMEILDELGLAEGLLRLPHTKASRLRFRTPRGTATLADFSRLKTRFPYLAFMPQWDFLDFVTDEARKYPDFRLEMNAEARELVEEDGVVRGLRYETPDGAREVRADLVVADDGRDSRVRERAGMRIVGTAPAIGAAAVVGLTVTGQQIASVFFDRWGLMRMPTEPVTGARLFGVGLLLVGVILIQTL